MGGKYAVENNFGTLVYATLSLKISTSDDSSLGVSYELYDIVLLF